MMLKAKQKDHFKHKTRETLLALLETLPGAMFVVDDAAKIVYANASAQILTEATQEDVCGKLLWHSAPQLVSTALYQAVQKATWTRKPAEVEYVSPVTRTWLHVQLVPSVEGLIVHVHQGRAASEREAPVPQRESFSRDDLDNVQAEIIFLTPDGLVLEMNELSLAEAQIQREEVLGQSLAETRVWSCSPTHQAQLRGAIARASKGETVRFEMVVSPREGAERHLDVTITPHRDADHHIAYLILAGIDIPARKQAEAEISALIDAIPQFVWIARPDGAVIYCNQRLLDYLAMTHEQAEGAGWLAGVHPDERQRVREVWQIAVQTGEPREVEYHLRDGTSGAYRWFLVRAMPIRNETGQIVKWIGTNTDIEERKQAERQLKASEKNWHALVDMIPQLVWVVRPDGCFEYVNQRARHYLGFSPECLLSDEWRQFIHPDDYEHVQTVRRDAFEAGDPYEVEYRLKEGETGCYRWFLGRALPIHDETGPVVTWLGTSTDIEEQKQAEQQLKESRENWRVLAETVPQLVWTTQPDGSVTYWNQRWYDYTGTIPEHALGHAWSQFVHPDDSQRALTVWHHALEMGEPYEVEYRLKEGQ